MLSKQAFTALALMLSLSSICFGAPTMAAEGEPEITDFIRQARSEQPPPAVPYPYLEIGQPVPIYYKGEGHVLFSDTDNEPYSGPNGHKPYSKVKEDIYFSNRICEQAKGMSAKKLEDWLGEPFLKRSSFFKNANQDDTFLYHYGGLCVPMVFTICGGQCTDALCIFKFTTPNLQDELVSEIQKFFAGKTASELVPYFPANFRIERQSLADDKRPQEIWYLRDDHDKSISIFLTNGKCDPTRRTVTFGDTSIYHRPGFKMSILTQSNPGARDRSITTAP